MGIKLARESALHSKQRNEEEDGIYKAEVINFERFCVQLITS